MRLGLCVILLSVLSDISAFRCNQTEPICEIWLTIDQALTLLTSLNGFPKPVRADNYSLYAVSSLPEDDIANLLPTADEIQQPKIIEEIPGDDVITGDGFPKHKLVYVVNGTLPGPSIETFEGQTLRIHVTNRLLSEMSSVHWHGMHQRESAAADGVPYITQDPILPGQTYTYTFRAEPKGTHYYHSHVAMQATMGVYGALIVHPRVKHRDYAAEHTILLSEWNHEWTSAEVFARWTWTAVYRNGNVYHGTKGPDSQFYGTLLSHSALLNGKGRFRNRKTGDVIKNPLEEFRIEPEKKYLFRIINAFSQAQFLLAFEGHDFELKSSDGYDLKSGYKGHALGIASGERYDLVITGKNTSGTFTILAKTLETPYPVFAEALLKYSDDDSVPPVVDDVLDCSAENPCIIFNCPTKQLPIKNSKCVNLEELERSSSEPRPPSNNSLKEYFLNFGYAVVDFYEGASVNARVFKPPTKTLLTTNTIEYPCDKAKCGQGRVCHCTNVLRYNQNDTIQLVLLNIGKNSGAGHPIHIHGYSFHVMDIGYPVYDEHGKYKTMNPNLFCNTTFCDEVTWVGGNDVIENGIVKDTINLPRGGYVVVRFKANNPGYWLLHCHQDIHLADGMAMLLADSKL